MTEAKKKALERVLCIYYPIQFKKETDEIWVLINLETEVNAMSSVYLKKLGLWMRKTNIRARKIDGSTLEIYGIVIADFQIQNKLQKARFFEDTSLVANINVEIVFEMSFLIFSKVKVDFAKKELI